MSAYEGFERVDIDGGAWDERRDGGGAFLGAHVEVRDEDLAGLDGEGLDELLADCPCRLGAFEGATDPETKGLSWMGRSVIGAAVAPTGRGVSFPVPPNVLRKVVQVMRGGFVGGAVGRAGKAARARYMARGDLFRKLNREAAATAGPAKAARLRNMANRAAALMIRDRLAIERLRYASVLKTHQVVKSVESDFHVREAARTTGLARSRHLAAAKAAGILSKKQAAGAKALLAQRIRFPEIDRAVAHLSKPRDASGFGPEAKAESQRRRLRLPASRRTSFCPPNPAALYNHFAAEDVDGLEGCGWDPWCHAKKAGGAVAEYGGKGLKKLDEAVDWADDKVGSVDDLANTLASVGTVGGGIIAAIPIPPVAQAVGGALIAAGAGIAAVAETTGAVRSVTRTIKGEKDKAKKVLRTGASLVPGDKRKKGLRLVTPRTGPAGPSAATLKMMERTRLRLAEKPGPSKKGKPAAKRKFSFRSASRSIIAKKLAVDAAAKGKDAKVAKVRAKVAKAEAVVEAEARSNALLYAAIAAGGIAIVGVGIVAGRRRTA